MRAQALFDGRLIMAPMTGGTDLPFRRLAAEWGAQICIGEMAYAHKVVKNDGSERVLLRRHPDEKIFGVQLAGKRPDLMAEAARIAVGMGADFVDVNLGCPIDDATRRGFGAALLQRPGRVAAIVEAMKSAVDVPVTIKLRLGWSSQKPTYLKIALAAQAAGVDAVGLHARSRAQRYRRPADWDRIAELVQALSVPVIGNGDVMTGPQAIRRLEHSGCAAVMTGRWALARPWIFREFVEGREIEQSPGERLAVLRRYVELCGQHFGTDERGRRRTRRFLTFHQDFFRRYRPGAGSEAVNSEDSRDWGADARDDLERWLNRADLPAVEALCDWLVDGKPAVPPGPADAEAPRAVKVAAHG